MLGGCSNKGKFDGVWARGIVGVGGKVDRISMGKLKEKCRLEDIFIYMDKFGNYFNEIR